MIKKRYKIGFLAILVIGIIFLFFLIGSPEKSNFKDAKQKNTIEAYENYLSNYENGKYVNEAMQKIEDIKFSQFRDSAFSSFINILKTNTDSTKTEIHIKPSNKVLMGTPINIELHHLPPNRKVTLHAYRRRWNGIIYSFASYQSDDNGQIILNKAEPIHGTYSFADSLGIFWSMTWPSQKGLDLPFEIEELKENTLFLYIEIDDKIIAFKELELIDKLPHIITEKIDTDTLIAEFHYPKDKMNIPILILIGGGSQGEYDWSNQFAKIVASHGYASLVLTYNNVGPLPKFLEKVPLEYFFNAINWVKRKPIIDSEKIIIAGGSRAGELVLLLASMNSDIKGVIALGPSCVIWQGLPHDPLTAFFSKPAWTLNGKGLPYVKHRLHLPTIGKFISGARQIDLMKMHEGRLDDWSKIEPALIKVEKINGPILFIAGKDDQMWPSYQMCQMMQHRLDSLHFKHPVKGLYYDNAGHRVTSPDLLPTIDYKYEDVIFGGTDSGNANAQIDSWNKMIEFLKAYFPIEKPDYQAN